MFLPLKKRIILAMSFTLSCGSWAVRMIPNMTVDQLL